MERKIPRSIEASAFLSRSHPKLAALVRRVGPPKMRYHGKREVFEALATAIVYQQLHGKAAASILARFEALFPGSKGFPAPEEILRRSAEELRACGLSRAKAAAILDLCEKSLAGLIPDRRTAARLSNEQLIERLTEVKGIGRWTVEMFLMFTLGRPDVLPVNDFGVRKGFMLTFGKKKMPTPQALEKAGSRWSPHRTLLAWYLWRATELK